MAKINNPFIVLKGGGGDGDNIAKGLADGTLTEFSAPALGVTSLAPRRFYRFSSLQALNLTGITNIPEYSAYQCGNLTNLILDNNTSSIGDYAFYQCENRSMQIDVKINGGPIGFRAFSEDSVRSIKGSCSNIGGYAFEPYGASASSSVLDEIDLTINGTLGDYVFGKHPNVTKFNLNRLSNITGLNNQYIFTGLGANRPNPETNIFIFDFILSSFI